AAANTTGRTRIGPIRPVTRTLAVRCGRCELRARMAASEPERELCVLAHLVGRPRRREHHLRNDLDHAIQLADELLHLLADLRPDGAARAGEREGDVDLVALDLDV